MNLYYGLPYIRTRAHLRALVLHFHIEKADTLIYYC